MQTIPDFYFELGFHTISIFGNNILHLYTFDDLYCKYFVHHFIFYFSVFKVVVISDWIYENS